MTDSKESFPRLLGERYYGHLLEGIAALELPNTEAYSENSQHDKHLADVFFRFLNWVEQSEERAFTGDPLDLPPDHPIVPILLEGMGLIAEKSSDEQV